MANLNKVMLMGNITNDIELRYTPKGTAVSDITLATNRVRTGESGEKITEATFVDVTLWGRTAEIVHQYCSKGSPLFVEGRLHQDKWVDKATGGNRSKLKVIAENIQLMGSKGGGGGGQQAPSQGQGGGAPAYSQDPPQQQQQDPAPQALPQGGSPAQGGQVEESEDIPF